MKRALVLKKDTLTELRTDELAAVAGGAVTERACTGYSLTVCTVCTVTTVVGPLPKITTVNVACAG
jgi:hypothetical protein